ECGRASRLWPLRLHAVGGGTRPRGGARRHRRAARRPLHLRVAPDHRKKPEDPGGRTLIVSRPEETRSMNQSLPISELGAKAVDVDIRNVDLFYGTNHVLKGINLHIRPGEFFAFLGPSGCGKTTLLRLIAGFNQADGGEVLLGGRDVSHLPPWKRDVGMVFQSYALWPHMTVKRNVAFGLEER